MAACSCPSGAADALFDTFEALERTADAIAEATADIHDQAIGQLPGAAEFGVGAAWPSEVLLGKRRT